jgi:hypothetical protein
MTTPRPKRTASHVWSVVSREPVELVTLTCSCGCGGVSVQVGRPGGPSVGVALPEQVVRAGRALQAGAGVWAQLAPILGPLVTDLREHHAASRKRPVRARKRRP